MNRKQEAFLTAVNGAVVSTEGFIQTLTDTLSFLGLRKSAQQQQQQKPTQNDSGSDYYDWLATQPAKVNGLEKALLNVSEVRKLPLKTGVVEGRYVSTRLYGEKTTFSQTHQRLTQVLKGIKDMYSAYPANLKNFKEGLLKLANEKETWDRGDVNLRKHVYQSLLKHTGRNCPMSLNPMLSPMLPDTCDVGYHGDNQLWCHSERDTSTATQLPALTTAEIIAAGKLIREINDLRRTHEELPILNPRGTLWGFEEGTDDHNKIDDLLDFIRENMDEDGMACQLAIPRYAFKYGWAQAFSFIGHGLEEIAESLLVWIFESVDMSEYEISAEARISLESWFGFGGKDGPDRDVKQLLELLKSNDVDHSPFGDTAIVNLEEKLGYQLPEGVKDLYRYVGSFRSTSGESPLVLHDSEQTVKFTKKLLEITKQFKDPVVFGSTYGGGYIYIATGKYVVESYIDEEDGELSIQGRHSETPAKFLTGEPADKQWR